MAVPEIDKTNNHTTRLMKWNKLKEYLPTIGYTVETKKKRVNEKVTQCYYITGEWHDVELTDVGFLQLVDAKLSLDEGK